MNSINRRVIFSMQTSHPLPRVRHPRVRHGLIILALAMSVSGAGAGTSDSPDSRALAAPVATATPSLSVTVGGAAIKIAGVTPGGDVVLFWFAKQSRGGRTHADARTTVVHDADGDGVVSVETTVPLRSVWVAIDTASGGFGTGAPPEFPLVVSQIPPASFHKDAELGIASLEEEIPRLVLLLVRPGKGKKNEAWILRGRDGGAGDHDGTANGRLKLAFEDTQSILDVKAKGPKHLQSGDVLAAIDPGHLDVFIGQITK